MNGNGLAFASCIAHCGSLFVKGSHNSASQILVCKHIHIRCHLFLLISTFFSSSLDRIIISLPYGSYTFMTWDILQLRREILTRVIIIPTLFPQVSIVTLHFCILLCPVWRLWKSLASISLFLLSERDESGAKKMPPQRQREGSFAYLLQESPQTRHLPLRLQQAFALSEVLLLRRRLRLSL